jgi:hypothetical protein
MDPWPASGAAMELDRVQDFIALEPWPRARAWARVVPAAWQLPQHCVGDRTRTVRMLDDMPFDQFGPFQEAITSELAVFGNTLISDTGRHRVRFLRGDPGKVTPLSIPFAWLNSFSTCPEILERLWGVRGIPHSLCYCCRRNLAQSPWPEPW